MTADSIQALRHAVPFQPFTIHLADGRFAKVPHPDFITVTGSGGTALVASDTDEHFSIIDLSLVTQLETGNTVSSAN